MTTLSPGLTQVWNFVQAVSQITVSDGAAVGHERPVQDPLFGVSGEGALAFVLMPPLLNPLGHSLFEVTSSIARRALERGGSGPQTGIFRQVLAEPTPKRAWLETGYKPDIISFLSEMFLFEVDPKKFRAAVGGSSTEGNKLWRVDDLKALGSAATRAKEAVRKAPLIGIQMFFERIGLEPNRPTPKPDRPPRTEGAQVIPLFTNRPRKK